MRTIPARRTKNGLTHIVPRPPFSVDFITVALDANDASPFLFPARRLVPQALDGNRVSQQCKALYREIGVPTMRLHDLRHQAATGMAECGVPLEIRQLVMNQITGRRQAIGARYDQHDYFNEKLRALTLWSAKLCACVSGAAISTERY